ncbi:MAG: MFS transporter [Candidatus Heimdallarchaeota archaeon]|nr:MAG: MFS transporter [Candidatus Heimdallarchaeota archaeon]
MDGIWIAFIHSILGISTFPKELQNLSLKFLSLQIVVSGIYLSYSWISLYYLSVLDSFSAFSIIVVIGMLAGAILDVPLGILTDHYGQRMAFCGALFCLMFYYLGLIFAAYPIHLILLEILVGIYSALISGSFISWFLNSWENIAPKSSEFGLLFRNIMGNISFAKSIIVALATFVGGILLQQYRIIPQFLFLIQALIAALGVILGLKFISMPKNEKKVFRKDVKNSCENQNPSSSRFPTLLNNLWRNYVSVIPFFIGFSILSFTAISFNTLVFSPLLYEIYSSNQTFNQNDFVIQFTTLSLLIITLTISLSNVIFAIFSRLSGKMTSFIKSAYRGIIVFYILNYPVVWMAYILVLIADFTSLIKLSLIIFIFFLKIILSGLATSLYWQLYYQITSSEKRSSQESLYNTINLIISIIGFGLIGIILESSNFVDTLLFLFLMSFLGILVLIIAKNPVKLEN